MSTPRQFKSGQFYGDVHHGARGSIFDIGSLKATRGEDEVETHRHDDAHFVFVLPELDAVVVITTTNFQVRDAHALSEKLLTKLIMPALMRP
ncbi:hypothetical protein ACQ4WP_18170 [Janthinobacterium sp. GB4P2]|uniref:hypothetical protein n=1 Tax=Janthinobacterium sp. GB4P2 TaxID=3424189 RepID=UPI003F1FE238